MGKSTVVGLLRRNGIPVYDADDTVHHLLSPHGAAVARVAQVFPQALRTNDFNHDFIDRTALSAVLQDDTALQRLEAILHPLVWEEADRFTTQMQAEGHHLVGFEVPLLFETGAETRLDVTLCVSAPLNVQYERVLARPGMNVDKLERILARQMPDEEKRLRADYMLENDGDLHHLSHQLDDILHRIHLQFHSPSLPVDGQSA